MTPIFVIYQYLTADQFGAGRSHSVAHQRLMSVG